MSTAGRVVALLVVTVAVLLLTFTGHGGPAHDDSPPGTVTWTDRAASRRDGLRRLKMTDQTHRRRIATMNYTNEIDIWQLLEQPAPDGCEAVQDLYSWSLNYDPGKGPFTMLLDLIGWTEDNMGEGMSLYDYTNRNLGYVELSKLAAALEEYASAPIEVRAHVETLMAAEAAQ